MATNKKKIFVTQTMSPGARALLNAAGRHRTGRISEYDLGHRLRGDAEAACAGSWRGAGRDAVRRAGAGSLQGYEGGDADRRRLRRRRCAGALEAQGAADGRGHRELAVGRRTGAVHDADTGKTRAGNARDGEGRHLGQPARRVAVRPLRQDGADHRFRPDRHPYRQALSGDGNERAGLRSVSSRQRKSPRPAARRCPISKQRCRARILSLFIARRRRKRSASSMPPD